MTGSNVQPQNPVEMTNFSYSDAVSLLKLHLLKTYPPGAMIPMSEWKSIPIPTQETKVAAVTIAAPTTAASSIAIAQEQKPKISKTLDLHAPPPPVSFENKALKANLNQLFPEMGLQKFALLAKRAEIKDSEALLNAIQTKLAACDLLILEEIQPQVFSNYKMIFGTESTLADVPASVEKLAYPEWSTLSLDKEAKKILWSRLSEVCRRPA